MKTIQSIFRLASVLLFISIFLTIASFISVEAQDTPILGRDQQISLCDYTQPVTTYQDLGLELNYHFYDDPYIEKTGDISRGAASTNFLYIYSNPDYSLNLNSNTHLSVSREELRYDASGAGRYNAYLNETNLFAFGGVQLDFSSSFSQLAGVKVLTGTGYGRFKNVTPLVQATLIKRMLVERDVVSQGLSNEILREIAQEIDQIDPETDLESAVTAIVSLVEDQAQLEVEQLSAAEVLRIREIIEEETDQRLCGWDVRGGIGYEALDPQGGERDFLVDAGARYARPFTPYAQFDLGVDFTSTFEFAEKYSLGAIANYSYQFTENIETSFKYSFLYRRGDVLTIYHQNFSATADIRVRRNLLSRAF